MHQILGLNTVATTLQNLSCGPALKQELIRHLPDGMGYSTAFVIVDMTQKQVQSAEGRDYLPRLLALLARAKLGNIPLDAVEALLGKPDAALAQLLKVRTFPSQTPPARAVPRKATAVKSKAPSKKAKRSGKAKPAKRLEKGKSTKVRVMRRIKFLRKAA